MPRMKTTTGLLACLVLLVGIGVAIQGVFLWRLNQHIESMFEGSSEDEDVLASLMDGLLGDTADLTETPHIGETPHVGEAPRIGEAPGDGPDDGEPRAVEPSATELLDQMLAGENMDENVKAMIDALREILSDPALQ